MFDIGTTPEVIAPRAILDHVRAVAAAQLVVTAAAGQHIVAPAAPDLVAPRFAGHGIVRPVATDLVVARAPFHDVGTASAVEIVASVPAIELVAPLAEAAFAYARELVDQGEYPTISAAVSGELARAHGARAREAAILEAEVRPRLELPLDQWVPVGSLDDLTAGAFARIDALEREAKSQGRG